MSFLSNSSNPKSGLIFVTSRNVSKTKRILSSSNNDIIGLCLLDKLVSKDAKLDDKSFLDLLKSFKSTFDNHKYDATEMLKLIFRIRWSLRYRSNEIIEIFKFFVLKVLSDDETLIRDSIDRIIECMKINSGGEVELQCYHNWFSAVRSIFVELSNRTNIVDKLFNQLVVHYPKSTSLSISHESFVYNLLKLYEEVPQKQHQILFALFYGLVSIDTCILKSDIKTYINQYDDDTTDKSLIDIIDFCLVQVYQFISKHKKDFNFWDNLCTVFEALVLNTVQCHFVQFVLFYLLALNSKFAEIFLDRLWFNIYSPDVNVYVKQISASYLASLLARAKFISFDVLKTVLKNLSNWIHSYMLSSDTTGTNYRSSIVFYSLCQCLFYLIAFRHQEFVVSKQTILFLSSLNLSKIITSKLNPLNFCSKAVVQLFGSITRNYQIVYCYSIIEKNSSFKETETEESIYFKNPDFFFPFDLNCLKKSRQYIEPYYRSHNFNIKDEMMDIDDDEITYNSYSPSNNFLEESSYTLSPGFM